MRLRFGIAAALVAILFVLLADCAAAQSSLRPSPSLRSPEATQPVETASFIAQKLRQMIDLQRQMVRELGRYMVSIKEGGGGAAIWIGIGFAFLYGAVHAVGPGHGKMVVASFFVGREAKVWQGVLMGLQIAVTHVAAAVILIWLVDISFRHFIGGSPAESIWVRMVSFGLIALIGVYLLGRAIRNTMMAKRHGIVHLHSHDHHHGDGEGHSHDLRQQGILALIAGSVPCTGAILVMLFALANDIVGTGVILVVAISAGMAITMSAFGVVSILFRRFVMNMMGSNSKSAAITTTVLEYVGALLILFVGLSFFSATLG